MLRNVKRQETALSKWVSTYLSKGQLAPDHLVMRIVGQRLEESDCNSGALFDGFPRTIVQAQLLDDYLAERNDQVDLVLSLSADESVLIDRMLKRAVLEGRADDTEETIQARLKVFAEQTAPLIEYYSKNDLVESIDSMRDPEIVFENIREVVRGRTNLETPH
jgi:adenylate kinase